MNNPEKDIVKQFHKLFYDSSDETWTDTFWLGASVLKCPLDLWVYQEIIYEHKPDIIIECGTGYGGGALFLSSMCDLVNNGRVISIDINELEGPPEHKRITYLFGSSISEGIVEQVKKIVTGKKKVMVILDSDHHKQHVLSELRIYGAFVTRGCYMIVEDTNLNGHPVYSDFGPGPMEGVEEFLKEDKEFVIDTSKEKFYLTFSPKGYLKKTANINDKRNKKCRHIDNILSEHALNLSNLVNLGEYYFNKGDYDICIEKFQEAVSYNDSDFKYHVMIKLALSFSKNNMLIEAEKLIDSILVSAPEKIEALYAMGSIYKEHNEFDRAVKYFNNVLDTDTARKDIFWAGAYFHSGDIFLKSNSTSLAVEKFKLCLEFNPNHNMALNYVKKFS